MSTLGTLLQWRQYIFVTPDRVLMHLKAFFVCFFVCLLKYAQQRPGPVAQPAELPSATLTSLVGAGSSPSHSSSDPAPGKAVKDGPGAWAGACMWEIQKKLLGLPALDQSSSGCCHHLESEPAEKESLLSL